MAQIPPVALVPVQNDVIVSHFHFIIVTFKIIFSRFHDIFYILLNITENIGKGSCEGCVLKDTHTKGLLKDVGRMNPTQLMLRRSTLVSRRCTESSVGTSCTISIASKLDMLSPSDNWVLLTIHEKRETIKQ